MPAARWSCGRRSRARSRATAASCCASAARRPTSCTRACSSTPPACTLRRWPRRSPGSTRPPIPRPWFAKGNYFALARRSPFTHLIYPVPEPGGLGVHVTLDLAGQARFGPDVEWLDIASPTRSTTPSIRNAPRRSTPRSAATGPGSRTTRWAGYSGIRPKLQDRAPRRRLHAAGARGARRRRAGEPVRHRVAGIDGEPGDRRGGRAAAGRLSARPRASARSLPS